MSIKIMAFDLDGTLLSSEKKLLDSSYKALEKAASMGVEIVPCTGRFFKAIPEEIRNLPFINYAITINGASIYDVKNDITLSSYEMENSDVIKLLEWMDQYDCIYDVYLNNWGYIQKDHHDKLNDYIYNPFYRIQVRENRTSVNDLKDFVKNSEYKIQKCQLFKEDDDFIKFAFSKTKSLFPDLEISSSEKNDIEYSHKLANKGNALTKLCEILGIDIKDSMGFGDGGNDVTLLKMAGIGVAMDNAKEPCEAAADFITHSCDEDGIAYAIEKFVF